MSTIKVSRENFDQAVLAADKPVIVDFWAEWCGPCKMISPILEEIATEMKDHVTVAKINIDENPEIAAQYGVRSIPTLSMFEKGQIKDSLVGAAPKGKLLEWVKKTL